MKIRNLLLLLTTAALAFSCNASVDGRARVQSNGAYAEFRAGYRPAGSTQPAPTWNSDVSDSNLCYRINFKGEGGEVIGSQGPFPGGSPQSGPVPPGTLTWERVVVPCPELPLPLDGNRMQGPTIVKDGGSFAIDEGPLLWSYIETPEGQKRWRYIVSTSAQDGQVYVAIGCTAPVTDCELAINGTLLAHGVPITWPNGFRSVVWRVDTNLLNMPGDNAISFVINQHHGEIDLAVSF